MKTNAFFYPVLQLSTVIFIKEQEGLLDINFVLYISYVFPSAFQRFYFPISSHFLFFFIFMLCLLATEYGLNLFCHLSVVVLFLSLVCVNLFLKKKKR